MDSEIKKDQMDDLQGLMPAQSDEKSFILPEHQSLQTEATSVESTVVTLSTDLTVVIGQIQAVLDELQAYITSHGGRVEFVELKDFVVFIRFYGACLSCPLSFYTLTYGIERHIKNKIPSILRVEALE